MVLLILCINAITYLILLYHYRINNNLIQLKLTLNQNNADNNIIMANNTHTIKNRLTHVYLLNHVDLGNNNTHPRFLMQPRIYNM